MINIDKEIQELTDEIKRLTLAKSERKDQLSHLLREREESEKKKDPPIFRDKAGVIIIKGHWLKGTPPGNLRSKGTVTGIKKWVTFSDTKGIKHVGALTNLLVSENV